jgi:hypothetical protein
LLDYPSHPVHLFATISYYPFASLSFPLSISSKDGTCNTNGHSNNNARNPPSLD